MDGQPVSGLDTSGGWQRDGWMYQLVVTVHLLNASGVLLLQVQVGQVNICSSVYETYSDKKTSL